jgi:hypothetical protein
VSADSPLAYRRAALWGALAAKVVGAWGLGWDIQWHMTIGRDSFWIAPHLMIYGSVVVGLALGWGVLAYEWWCSVPSTRGFRLAALGLVLVVLAAPIDDLWHRLFGIDVTLWSPPHLLGLVGVTINTLGCALIAREAYPAKSWVRFAGVVIALTSFYGSLSIGLRPASRLAYLYGGLWFYAFPILGALFLPLAMITAVRLSGRRWTPIALVIVGLAVGTIGVNIARIGFEIMQPVSVIEAEIAKDPTSPIAVSHAIARKNGSTPGGVPGGSFARFLSLVPVLLLIAVDPRRRPMSATLVYALGLFALWAFTIGRTPAFQPMMPGPVPTVVALVIAIAMAVVGGLAARWLAETLATADRVPVDG